MCVFPQGVGGAVQYPKTYLKEAYELVRERGGVCIADEVVHVKQISVCDLKNVCSTSKNAYLCIVVYI